MSSNELEFVFDLLTPGADTWIGMSYAFELESVVAAKLPPGTTEGALVAMDPEFGWIWHDPHVAYGTSEGQYRAWGAGEPSYVAAPRSRTQ